jgi:trans-2-enoyl-CoA reductase
VVKMKGQVFMIVSVFILLFLFLLRINTQTIDLKPKDLFYEDFSNLKGEIIKTIDISLLNQENLQNNLNDFITFSKEFYNNKGYTEDVNYSISTTGDVTTVYLNISFASSKSYLRQDLIINRTLRVFA